MCCAIKYILKAEIWQKSEHLSLIICICSAIYKYAVLFSGNFPKRMKCARGSRACTEQTHHKYIYIMKVVDTTAKTLRTYGFANLICIALNTHTRYTLTHTHAHTTHI